MMFKKCLAVAALVLAMAPMAQAQITNIDDIQLYTDAGAINSPFNGLVVTVRGNITAVKGTYNGGTHYIQDATGGMNFFDSAAPTFAVGDLVEVTGTVSSFSGEINISGPFTYNFINTGTPPAPAEYTVAQAVDNDGSGTLNSADYEILGALAAVEGTVVLLSGQTPPWDPTATGQGSFGLTDLGAAVPDTFPVFIDRTTGIDPTGIAPGDLYRVVGPISIFSAQLQLKPRFQADVIENPGDPFPTVENIVPNPWTPEANDAVTVFADISDNGSITSASLFYAYGGSGSFTSVAMVDDGFGTYSATIPGTTQSSIEYYVVATDNSSQTTSVPGDAPTTTLGVAVGLTTIVEIQSTLDVDGVSSALAGQLVNVEAIVTVAPGEVQTSGLSNYAISDAAGGPWSAIFVFEGSGANVFLRGDKVRISGTVGEFNGITELLPQSGAAVELVSFGNDLPAVPVLSTDVLDNNEKWEALVVATFRAAVTDTIFGGAEWELKDATSDSSVYIDPAPSVATIATLGEEQYVTGFLDTRFGRNEIVPRNDDDIVLANAVAIGDGPTPRNAYFEGISPNPFNPNTNIKFNLPAKGKVELAIFNARGQRVNTLVSEELTAGSHVMAWDGRDADGASVGSGVYYARLRFGSQSLSMAKLTLVK